MQKYGQYDLYFTNIDYYPRVRYHFREREKGVTQTILIHNVKGKHRYFPFRLLLRRVLKKLIELRARH